MINKLEYIKEINILKYLKYLNISSDNFRFNCLFHESQSKKSMTINNQNKCYCWSCDKAFDIIDIYQKIKNVDFETALNDL
ncbi:MAG: CHC2 zinc finger domain-containing protein, partial (plasmid) [Phytoplasma sp.]|uniref:CHC2 zinc finger domain-containing protein n=1 Tax=Phytoplasma sp. TaxID=2155 RepID=UPI002B4028F1